MVKLTNYENLIRRGDLYTRVIITFITLFAVRGSSNFKRVFTTLGEVIIPEPAPLYTPFRIAFSL
jgi:hypothetical protein